MNSFASLLVQNLKQLNAKERDHLMRFAYLGATGAYEDNADRWLSVEMERALKDRFAKSGLDASARCVFASMDYHLDWLHVALLLACNKEIACDQMGLLDDGLPDDSLRPVIGIQEDLDLLVVFATDSNVFLLCIEAKGDASFDKVQLARKLIRLDRIIVASGAINRADLQCTLVLIAPKTPAFTDCLEYTRSLPGGKFSDMRDYLEHHPSGIGGGVKFVELAGFPKTLKKVTRTDPANASSKEFTHWRIKNR